MNKTRTKSAFTLIELLVVIAIANPTVIARSV